MGLCPTLNRFHPVTVGTSYVALLDLVTEPVPIGADHRGEGSDCLDLAWTMVKV
jgi:hypothetical protein